MGNKLRVMVNKPSRPADRERLKDGFERGRPAAWGSRASRAEIARKMGLEHTINLRGRPEKEDAYGETVDVTFAASTNPITC
jgi:hypothetical protein